MRRKSGIFLATGFIAALLTIESTSVFADGISWEAVYPRMKRIGLAAAGRAVESGIERSSSSKDLKEWLAGTLGDGLKAGLGHLAQEGLDHILSTFESAGDYESSRAIHQLRSSIDSNTTPAEYDAILARINTTMADHEARLQDLALTAAENRVSINEIKRQQLELRERFESSLVRLDLEIARIKGKQEDLERKIQAEAAERLRSNQNLQSALRRTKEGLERQVRDEAAERQRADDNLKAQIDLTKDDVNKLFALVSPETRRSTAARLASGGAIQLLANGNVVDATRSLQLAVAYDKVSEKHADPGSRYYLAVAYRRTGDNTKAEEMVMEAIAAERFRALPRWYYRLTERFQGEDRLWVESFRQDPRFGVRAPREVVLLDQK